MEEGYGFEIFEHLFSEEFTWRYYRDLQFIEVTGDKITPYLVNFGYGGGVSGKADINKTDWVSQLVMVQQHGNPKMDIFYENLETLAEVQDCVYDMQYYWDHKMPETMTFDYITDIQY